MPIHESRKKYRGPSIMHAKILLLAVLKIIQCKAWLWHFVLNHYGTFHTLFTLGKKENGQINKQCQKDQSHLFDSIKLWDLQYYSVKEIRTT